MSTPVFINCKNGQGTFAYDGEYPRELQSIWNAAAPITAAAAATLLGAADVLGYVGKCFTVYSFWDGYVYAVHLFDGVWMTLYTRQDQYEQMLKKHAVVRKNAMERGIRNND